MDFVLFIHQDASESGAGLKRIIEEKFCQSSIQTIQTFNSFKKRLKEPPSYNNEIYILFADTKHLLTEFLELRDLFEDRRIILILPDDAKSTLSKAHRLFPRFLTTISDTYEDLCSVLCKMIRPENENNSERKHLC
jgi:hypothetical protein